MKRRILTLLAFFLPLFALAQEEIPWGLPYDVYYLMPSFGNGLVYIKGQGPAQGKLNICALNNTLRFLDKDGKEVEASETDNIIMVRIDTVSFLQGGGVFFRMYPVSGDLGVALRRNVVVHKDVKEGAFGTQSHTSSITEYKNVYVDGISYDLGKTKKYPYNVTETVFLYKGNDILALSKRNLRKLFPEKKAEIDAWFRQKHSLPETVEEAKALLARWMAD